MIGMVAAPNTASMLTNEYRCPLTSGYCSGVAMAFSSGRESGVHESDGGADESQLAERGDTDVHGQVVGRQDVAGAVDDHAGGGRLAGRDQCSLELAIDLALEGLRI